MLSGKSPMNHSAVANWIRATATDVSLTYGRFPNPSPQVVVVPVSGARGTVAFGRVVRDGGETVELLIDPEGDTSEFFTDWTATHEFSHTHKHIHSDTQRRTHSKPVKSVGSPIS